MEQINNTAQTPQGKGMGVAGFVISLISFLLFGLIAFISYAQVFAAGLKSFGESQQITGGYFLSYSWLILCIMGLVLSILGMIKLGKSGGKRGLSIAGMVLGILATLATTVLVIVVHVGNNEAKKRLEEVKAFKDINLEGFQNEINQAMDTLQSQMNEVAPADSTAH